MYKQTQSDQKQMENKLMGGGGLKADTQIHVD